MTIFLKVKQGYAHALLAQSTIIYYIWNKKFDLFSWNLEDH